MFLKGQRQSSRRDRLAPTRPTPLVRAVQYTAVSSKANACFNICEKDFLNLIFPMY